MNLEDILQKAKFKRSEVIIPLDVFEELLEEVFYSPEEETEDLLSDPQIRKAIENFKKGQTKFYSLEEVKKRLDIK